MAEVTLNLWEMQDYRTNEAFKSLRTNLEFSGRENKVLLVTSCTPDEGKSTVALFLAASLAESGKRVLLVDADLRKSVLYGRCQIHGKIKGLSHYLSGQSAAKETVCGTNVAGLDLIFAGPVPPNPAELLGTELFAQLIRDSRGAYDYVLVDTPPLGSVIDSAVVAKNCDAAVMVISAQCISYKYARNVKRQMERSGCRILGVVLNKVNIRQDKYYGRYYGKYYGSYGR